jgi:hypothetical protein
MQHLPKKMEKQEILQPNISTQNIYQRKAQRKKEQTKMTMM